MLGEVKRLLVSEPGRTGWNITETLVLVLPLIALLYFLPGFLSRRNIELDRRLFAATTLYALPVAALAATLGALKGGLAGILFMAASLELSGRAHNFDRLSVYGTIGVIAAIISLLFANPNLLLTTSAVILPFAGAATVLASRFNTTLLFAVVGQYFDAASSFAVLSRGGSELHVLGGWFVEQFGPQGIFVLKTLVVLPAVLYLYSEAEPDRKTYYMFLIGFLGLTIGLSNLFRA